MVNDTFCIEYSDYYCSSEKEERNETIRIGIEVLYSTLSNRIFM